MPRTEKRTRIVSGGDVKAELKEIPKWEMNYLVKGTLRSMKRFFEQPGVQEDYEKWLVDYKKKHPEQYPESAVT